MAKQDDYIRYTVRIPRTSYAAIEIAAVGSHRSANAEIVARIEHSLEQDKGGLESVRLRLTPEAMAAASMTAAVHDQSMEEFVADAVLRASEQVKGHRSAKDKIDELQKHLQEAERQVSDQQKLLDERERSMHLLEATHEAETGLMFVLVNSFGAFLNTLIRVKEAVPSDIMEDVARHRQSVDISLQALRSASHLDDAEAGAKLNAKRLARSRMSKK